MKKKGFCHCCKGDTSSLDEDFPNRADIKPLMSKFDQAVCGLKVRKITLGQRFKNVALMLFW